MLLTVDPNGYGAGDLSQSAFVDYVNWWQNIIGIVNNNEEPVAEPAVTPIDQNACAPCSEYNITSIGSEQTTGPS